MVKRLWTELHDRQLKVIRYCTIGIAQYIAIVTAKFNPVPWFFLCFSAFLFQDVNAANQAPLAPAPAAAVLRTSVRVTTDKNELAVLVNDRAVTTLTQLTAKRGTVRAGDVDISVDAEGQLVIAATAGEAVVEADAFAGWAAKVPAKNQLAMRLRAASGELELGASSNNTAVVTMRFSDGGAAELSPGALGHLDIFKDKSYYFSGFGKVNVNSADGDAFGLSNLRPPMTGGPLGQTSDGKGGNRFKRLTPLIEVWMGADMSKETSIKVGLKEEGGEVVKLLRGEKQKFTLANGSSIEFYLNPDSHMVEWKIEKGLFRFRIEGYECWRALGLTGQRAGQMWDGEGQAVDLANMTTTNSAPKPNHNLYASFSRSTHATVSPDAMLMYAPISACHTYNVSSRGGTVILYDSDTRSQMALTDQNFLMKPDRLLLAAGRPVGSNRAIKLAWDAGSTLDIGGVLGEASVVRNSEKTLTGPDGAGKVDLSYSLSGDLIITAREGDFLLQPTALDNWGIELHEGDSMTLNLDSRKGIFTLRTGQDNTSMVKVSTADGFQPLMNPDTVLTFIMGRSGTLLPESIGALVFYEAAGGGLGGGPTLGGPGGSGTPEFRQGPPMTPTPSGSSVGAPYGSLVNLDVSRIVQPPVSVVGQ
jgi:hypothetical protein